MDVSVARVSPADPRRLIVNLIIGPHATTTRRTSPTHLCSASIVYARIPRVRENTHCERHLKELCKNRTNRLEFSLEARKVGFLDVV